jgi:hypothetical protein
MLERAACSPISYSVVLSASSTYVAVAVISPLRSSHIHNSPIR